MSKHQVLFMGYASIKGISLTFSVTRDSSRFLWWTANMLYKGKPIFIQVFFVEKDCPCKIHNYQLKYLFNILFNN